MFVCLSAGDIPREGERGARSEAGPRAAHQRVPRHRLQVPRRRRAEGAQRQQQQGMINFEQRLLVQWPGPFAHRPLTANREHHDCAFSLFLPVIDKK